MAKIVPEAICRENYQKLCNLFNNVVENAERFKVVYVFSTEQASKNYIVVRKTTTTYFSYALGYDEKTNELVLLEVDRDMSEHGEPMFIKREELKRAHMGLFSKLITLLDDRFANGALQLTALPIIDRDPEEVSICVWQDVQVKEFNNFFKKSFKK